MDPLITGGLVAGGLNLIGDMVSQSNARSAFKSRYQDTVADMRKAGLNPALAYGQGGGNPQTSDYGDIGSAAVEGGQSYASARQAREQAELTRAQKELLVAQKNDLATITANRARASHLLPDMQRFKNITAEAQSIMAMIEQRQREATNLSDVRARLSRNDMQSIATELAKLNLPEARAVAKWFQGPIGRNERNIDKILDVIRAVRSGGGGGRR